LYTSATDRPSRRARAGKTALVYLGFSGFCVFFDRVYALFGHGVFSAHMTLMFLYPLLGGALPFFLLWRFLPRSGGGSGGRVRFNCYNSGIAALTMGSLLRGVFDIAGTASGYCVVFSVCGWAVTGAGAALFLLELIQSRLRAQI
jgi:hypothetical protein